eukprot:COSAG01_NODE_39076_length_481_cov_1.060209_2_plen_67_part_01
MATMEGWAPFLCDLGVSQIFVAQGEEERQKEAEQQAQEVEGGKGRCKSASASASTAPPAIAELAPTA